MFDSVLQLIFSIFFRNDSYTSPLNCSVECTLLKYILKTAHNACNSKDVDALTYPTGASLSDILFSFVLKKYIVCDICGLRSSSFEPSNVLYITPTNTSYIQDLILQGMQKKLQKSCSRLNKNTWHVDSNYILQPPKYLLLFSNRFRFINNNVTENRCSIPMDATAMLVPLKFKPTDSYRSPWAICTFRSLYCIYQLLQNHSIASTTKIRSLKLLIAKTLLLHMLYFMNWLTY